MKNLIKLYYKSALVLGLGVLLLFIVPLSANAKYCASKIPDALLENANSVYRVNHMEVAFNGEGQFTIKREVVVTILNENGKGPDVLRVQYDGVSRARFRGGHIYDARGNTIQRIRRRDLSDQSNVSDFSLFEDSRIMVYVPRISDYPYTVSYTWEVSYDRGMYHSTSFYSVPGFGISAEVASLVIELSDDLEIQYKVFNVEDQSMTEETLSRGRQRLVWEFETIPARKSEVLSPGLHNFIPMVMFAPDRFEYSGYHGRNTSWKEFGKWIWSLNEGRDQLPEARKKFLREMVSDMDNDKEKVKAIYNFLQSHTRYVNISLGVGGMQPFDAKTVDETGYGDCKALTNYMMAMLQAVGINAYYTLVRSGKGRHSIFEDFSANQFDHVILCVPLEKDTVWLENVSHLLPFNHLGDFTDNRPVLIIREDGGFLARTPAYNPQENIRNSYAEIELNNQGHGSGRVERRYGGIYFMDFMPVSRLSSQRQKEWLYSRFSLPNYTIESNEVVASTDTLPFVMISMDVSLRSFASTSGRRMFMPMNAISSSVSAPPRNRNRVNPFILSFETVMQDTIIFTLPEGYYLEREIQDFSAESQFGKYEARTVIQDNTLLYIRSFETYTGTFPAEKYADFFDFYRRIVRVESQDLVLVKED